MSAIICIRVEDDGLPLCPDCGKRLLNDWHGVAACFCLWGGREPTVEEIVNASESHSR